MPPLKSFPLPLPSNGPPEGFGFLDHDLSELSTRTAFETSIDCRDVWHGKERCVVCGSTGNLEHCHIIPQCNREKITWATLKDNKYIPPAAKSPQHEPRNGILMCPSHHKIFDHFDAFIRYVPTTRQLVFVNCSGDPDPLLVPYHGKSILMNMDDRHAPFPALFLIHEQRARGYWPFAQPPDIPTVISPQDWLISDGQSLQSNGRNACSASHLSAAGPPNAVITNNVLGHQAPSGSTTLTLDANTITEIVAATWSLESWKACVQEGTSWEGTADENIAKYTQAIAPSS